MKLVNKILLFVIVSIVCTGCISVKYPMRKQYMLNVPTPKVQAKVCNAALDVDTVSIAPQFSSLSFVYRTSNIDYTKDFYNIFFIPPAQQIQQLIINYLQSKKIFKYIANGGDFITINYYLKPKIKELYADYRNSNHPKAVITINFILYSAENKARILLNKTFRAEVALQKKDSVSLVNAWNLGLQKILTRLSVSLCKVKFNETK